MADFTMLLQWLLLTMATLLFLNAVYKSIKSSKNTINDTSFKKGKKAPVAAGARPFIGHLHMLVGGKQLPHQALGKLADKYGPAFIINIGPNPELVVSSWELAKECFTINDRCFTDRPSNKAMKYLTYDEASVGFAPYGPLWVEMRKIAKSNLLSQQRLQVQKRVRVLEIDLFFKELHELWSFLNNKDDHAGAGATGTSVIPLSIDMKKWFEELTLNVITRMVSGKHNYATKARKGDTEAKRFKRVISEAAHFTGRLLLSDIFPSLGFLDNMQGRVSSMKRTGKELDSVLSSWVEEHRQKRVSGNKEQSPEDDDVEQDFIDLTLSMMEEIQLHWTDADTFIKAICVGVILGGSDTTSVGITWILSLLMNHPDVLKKAREELDQQVGLERKVDDSDLNNLAYLRAIVKESMRLYQVGPLIERKAKQDCNIGGFHLKAGTRLLVNLSKVHKDPTVWSDPNEFRPERFFTTHTNIDIKGQNFELIPFGSGRRMCPGYLFALSEIYLVLARLIHGFELRTPNDAKLDMTETSSVTNYRATPLQVLLTPRLSSKLY